MRLLRLIQLFWLSSKYYLRKRSKYPEGSIAIDFDGVLATYKKGMADRNEQGYPLLNALESMYFFKRQGLAIIIFTSRPITRKLRKWFKKNNIPYDFILPKPDCVLFIDDRALTFKGEWHETMKEIKEFSPWWEDLEYMDYVRLDYR